MKRKWGDAEYVGHASSRRGLLESVSIGGVKSIYLNGMLVLSENDHIKAKYLLDLSMTGKGQDKEILIIGGCMSGFYDVAGRYRGANIKCIEQDDDVNKYASKISKHYSETLERHAADIIYMNERSYLNEISDKYDVVIINKDIPASLNANRFYTKEFFELIKRKMSEDGVLVFQFESANIAMNQRYIKFLASMESTVKTVFRHVRLIPGDSIVFYIHDSASGLDTLQAKSAYESYLLRENNLIDKDALMKMVRQYSDKIKINGDMEPNVAIYAVMQDLDYYHYGIFIDALDYFLGLKMAYIFIIPLMMLLVGILVSGKGEKRLVNILKGSTILNGLSAMSIQMMLIYSFQIYYGELYGYYSTLTISYMMGIALGGVPYYLKRGKESGCVTDERYKKNNLDIRKKRYIYLYLALTVLPLFISIPIKYKNPSMEYIHVMSLLSGVLSGTLMLQCHKTLKSSYVNDKNGLFGELYYLDILGGAASALFITPVLSMLLGFEKFSFWLFLINSGIVIYLQMSYGREGKRLNSAGSAG